MTSGTGVIGSLIPSPGAGVDIELFCMDTTLMVFGDAERGRRNGEGGGVNCAAIRQSRTRFEFVQFTN
jgi:hypothetical protein